MQFPFRPENASIHGQLCQQLQTARATLVHDRAGMSLRRRQQRSPRCASSTLPVLRRSNARRKPCLTVDLQPVINPVTESCCSGPGRDCKYRSNLLVFQQPRSPAGSTPPSCSSFPSTRPDHQRTTGKHCVYMLLSVFLSVSVSGGVCLSVSQSLSVGVSVSAACVCVWCGSKGAAKGGLQQG